jgi:hypothetical protein
VFRNEPFENIEQLEKQMSETETNKPQAGHDQPQFICVDHGFMSWRQSYCPHCLPSDWQKISERMPPLDWLCHFWDGHQSWIGFRSSDADGSGAWAFTNSYCHFWWNGDSWAGDAEWDDDYKPTHWRAITPPPKS